MQFRELPRWKMVKIRNSNPLIPLNEAVWHFAPRKLRLDFERAQSQPAKYYSPRYSEDVVESSQIGLAILKSAVYDFTAQNKPLWDMQKHLMWQLSESKLEAVGVITKPNLENEQKIIPAIFFKGDPRPKWGRSSIENLGRKFELIEVRRQTEATTPINIQPQSKPKRPGRPSVGAEITQVATDLQQKEFFLGRSEKERVAIVQIHCRRRFPKLFPKDTRPSKSKVRDVLKTLDI